MGVGFSRGIRPAEELPVVDWIERNVRLGSWARSPVLDLSVTPWLRRPYREAEGNECRVMVLRMPTGSGKSTFFEGLVPWVVRNDPGPMQISFQKDDQARRWMETRMVKVLQNTSATREVLDATHRHRKRKFELLLPTMDILTGGASEGNLQDVSIQWVLGQEVWQWTPGMLGEARARTHDRWNAREIFCGQGGVVGGDFAELDGECEQFDYGFRCPGCRERVRFLPREEDFEKAFRSRFKWDEEETGRDEVDWAKVEGTVRMVCDCGKEFRDRVGTRRMLSTSLGDYVSAGNLGVPGYRSFSLPVWAVWWIPWVRMVQRFVAAVEERGKGNVDGWRQLIQKRGARHYEEGEESPEVVGCGYSRELYYQGERWPGEVERHLRVDVQKSHFWASARAWQGDGRSRLLWEGRVGTIEQVRELQERLRIRNWAVCIDGRYSIDRVAEWRVRFMGRFPGDHANEAVRGKPNPKDAWTIVMGEEAPKGYPHKVRVPGGRSGQTKTVARPFSTWQRGRSSSGIGYEFIKFSNLMCKDVLAGMLSEGKSQQERSEADGTPVEPRFGVFDDFSKDYGKHMAAEIKREVKPGVWRWEKVKPHYRNDLWDTEVMGVALASVRRLIKVGEESDG